MFEVVLVRYCCRRVLRDANDIAVYNVRLPTLWTTIVRRIAVEHLLNVLRINFDIEPTPFQLEQRG